MLKAVIFDMDGVIIDSEHIHVQLEEEIFSEYGIPVDSAEHHLYIGTSEKQMFTSLKDKYHFDYTVEELVAVKRLRFTKYLLSTDTEKPIKGIPDLIDNLKENGVILMVASSSPMEHIQLVLNKFNLTENFLGYVSSCNVVNSKPAPDVFIEAAKIADVDPSECIVIEDSHNGVKAAKAAGMICIGYHNPNSGNQDLSAADTLIKTINELNYEALIEIL